MSLHRDPAGHMLTPDERGAERACDAPAPTPTSERRRGAQPTDRAALPIGGRVSATTGIETRHRLGCPARDDGGRCKCDPSYRAWVWDETKGRKVRRTFPTYAAAKSWRQDAQVAVRRGALVVASDAPLTVGELWTDWLAKAGRGEIRNRSGRPYKPSALRGYEAVMTLRVLPELGDRQVATLRRVELQDYVDRLVAKGMNASTVHSCVTPLRTVFRRAVQRDELVMNPAHGLQLPAVEKTVKRIASPAEGAALLAALPEQDRAVWATAMYAGLRCGELQALRWENIDLQASKIRVEHGWDARAGLIAPKSVEGRRTVPIASVLREYLIAHRLRSGRFAGFVFGRSADRPFDPGKLRDRAKVAWTDADLEPIGLHACRHTYASLMIAAGVNAKALSVYMGHANIKITLDTYGHLMPGNEDEAAGMLDAYLTAATAAAEGAS